MYIFFEEFTNMLIVYHLHYHPIHPVITLLIMCHSVPNHYDTYANLKKNQFALPASVKPSFRKS
jgi:hypothetical protein